jgi:hypothetical protein
MDDAQHHGLIAGFTSVGTRMPRTLSDGSNALLPVQSWWLTLATSLNQTLRSQLDLRRRHCWSVLVSLGVPCVTEGVVNA